MSYLPAKAGKRGRATLLGKAVFVGFLGYLVSGCALPVVGVLTVADLSTGASLTSTLLVGKGIADHTADFITGKDCRFIEGMLREDRELCEPVNAAATREDFRGLVGIALREDAPGALLAVDVQRVNADEAGRAFRIASDFDAGLR
jgi:hypothetical protein